MIPGISFKIAEFCGFRASNISSSFGKPCIISPVIICSNFILPNISSFFIKLPDFSYSCVVDVKKNGVPLCIINLKGFTAIIFPDELILENLFQFVFLLE